MALTDLQLKILKLCLKPGFTSFAIANEVGYSLAEIFTAFEFLIKKEFLQTQGTVVSITHITTEAGKLAVNDSWMASRD